MKKSYISKLFFLVFSFLLFTVCFSYCCRKPESCHYKVTIINNSDSIVSYSRLTWFGSNQVALTSYKVISPHDSIEYALASPRDCIEDLIVDENFPSTNLTLFILPDEHPFIITNLDSLDITYNILKIIDLCEYGADSLNKTNYIVYYP